MDDEKYVGSVFIIWAFDSITHDVLFSKLSSYVIVAPALRTIQTYLKDRQETVNICGVNSTRKTINIGVPEGSIFGGLLFLVCITYLPTCLGPTTYYLL